MAKLSKMERRLARVIRGLQAVSEELYGVANVRRLRSEVCAGVVSLDKRGQKLLGILLKLEEVFHRHYKRLVQKLASMYARVARGAGADREDYLQTGLMTMLDCIWNYTGESKFSTYLYESVMHSMQAMIQSQSTVSGVSRKVNRYRILVHDLVSRGMEPRQAVDKIVEQEGLSKRMRTSLLRSLYQVEEINGHVYRLGGEMRDLRELEDKEYVEYLMDKAGLTQMERKLLRAWMEGDTEYRKKLMTARDSQGRPVYINPATGKAWGRQTLSNIFQRALAKVREVALREAG